MKTNQSYPVLCQVLRCGKRFSNYKLSTIDPNFVKDNAIRLFSWFWYNFFADAAVTPFTSGDNICVPIRPVRTRSPVLTILVDCLPSTVIFFESV